MIISNKAVFSIKHRKKEGDLIGPMNVLSIQFLFKNNFQTNNHKIQLKKSLPTRLEAGKYGDLSTMLTTQLNYTLSLTASKKCTFHECSQLQNH